MQGWKFVAKGLAWSICVLGRIQNLPGITWHGVYHEAYTACCHKVALHGFRLGSFDSGTTGLLLSSQTLLYRSLLLQTGHVRRFFYIDTQLSASAAADAGSSQAVVFPSSMSLLIQIQPNARNMIFPPLLTLE